MVPLEQLAPTKVVDPRMVDIFFSKTDVRCPMTLDARLAAEECCQRSSRLISSQSSDPQGGL